MAASVGISAFGTLYQIDSDPSGTYTTVAELTAIGGPNLSTDDIDMTHHESPNSVKEYIAGLREGGEVTFTMNFIVLNTTHDSGADGIVGLWKAGAKRDHQIIFPDAGTTIYRFPSYVKGVTFNEPVDNKLSADVTCKVAGDLTFTT